MRALRVDAIADSGQPCGGRAFNDGLREAALHHAPIHVARCGDRWSTDDGVTLSVLSPCGALFADGKNDQQYAAARSTTGPRERWSGTH